MATTTLQALVSAMRHEAQHVVSVELRPADEDVAFPAFAPGSHLDLHLPNGLVRSYSLCNPSSDRNRYVIAVLEERNSRGGSRFVHRQLRVGQRIAISSPRNNFALCDEAARSILVAGGIGITPILSMLDHLIALGRRAELIYCARSRREAAFVDAISAMQNSVEITWHFDEQDGPPDLPTLLAGRGTDSHYYCCGPAPMLESFERASRELGNLQVHLERFAARVSDSPAPRSAFEVVCEKSGKTVLVSHDQSILEALIDAGLDPAHSCREGVCGACETKVVAFDGVLDHRDGILSSAERQLNKSMMICVSRFTGRQLVLDA